ncbi:UNVERIFIED_CONTAM: RRP12-like protein [Sesamum radiatum]|uniref:RRP12-like protein n=1 Tax=Sesamum radiatum TaxID=300843 RepID=A0AAW2N9R0_SESRA
MPTTSNPIFRSSAAQHAHLCATAAATRSIIQSSSLPLTPISYFAATITSLSNSTMLDSNALGALTSFLSIVLPLVGGGEIKPEKAGEAVRVLVRTVEENAGSLGTSGVRAVVKCVGVLVAEFCDLKEWDSVALGFEWLVKFSLDNRPKVRKCAQDCLLTVFKSFESSGIFKKASKSIYLLLKDHMPLAIEMTSSGIVDGSKNQAMPMSRPEHQEVLHLLNVIKHVVPHLSPKVRMRMLSQLLKILSSQFSVLTRHVFDVISAIFETSGTEVITSNAEDIFRKPRYGRYGNYNAEIKAVETTCTTFYNLLCASSQIPSEHFFSVVAFLFLRLGEVSAIFMKHILLKLGDLMNATSASGSETKHLQDCIGSAVAAMGPEKLLGLLPISLSTKNYSCSNIWLLPILKKNIVGSSLRFFMEHIVPLAESFEKGSRKVKNSVIGQDLQAYAHGCWDLLPAFCRHPSDTYQSFGALTQLLIRYLKKESFMLENIAIGLQELVNENKNAHAPDQGSVQLIEVRITKEIFIDSLEKFQLLDDIGEHGNNDGSANEKEDGGTDAKRSQILDLASCVVEGSDNDMVNLLFAVTRRALQVSDEVAQMEAYQTLSRILEKHSWFCSSQFAVVVDLLNAVKCSANITLLKGRFACLQALLIHALMRNVNEENTDAFLILNEIILALKDSNEEGRKVAYDALHGISSKLRSSSDASYDGLYHKLLTMITGYLSGSSPHIKSGVVSALSVLIYNDPDIGLTMPDIVPSVMELLHSKAVEVIKAVLGFVKVLVSCLKPNDLQHFLSNIMDGIIRWSSVSRHHFKTKVIVILEIMMRKCGSAAVKAIAPEKYKDFVHGVVVNRHGKTNSKEGGNNDTRPELSDASLKGQQKRKRNDSAISSKEEGSARPWKRQRDKKQNAGKSVGRGKHSSHYGDLQKGKLDKNRGSEVRDFKTKLSGGKKHEKRIPTNRKDEGKIHKPAVASKSPKRKREGRKDRRSAAHRA